MALSSAFSAIPSDTTARTISLRVEVARHNETPRSMRTYRSNMTNIFSRPPPATGSRRSHAIADRDALLDQTAQNLRRLSAATPLSALRRSAPAIDWSPATAAHEFPEYPWGVGVATDHPDICARVFAGAGRSTGVRVLSVSTAIFGTGRRCPGALGARQRQDVGFTKSPWATCISCTSIEYSLPLTSCRLTDLMAGNGRPELPQLRMALSLLRTESKSSSEGAP